MPRRKISERTGVPQKTVFDGKKCSGTVCMQKGCGFPLLFLKLSGKKRYHRSLSAFLRLSYHFLISISGIFFTLSPVQFCQMLIISGIYFFVLVGCHSPFPVAANGGWEVHSCRIIQIQQILRLENCHAAV